MVSEVSKAKVPISNPSVEEGASDLLIKQALNRSNDLIGEVEVKSGEQTRITLGNYDSQNTPKGFLIDINSSSVDSEIVRQVTKFTLNNSRYELVLHIANYSDKTVGVEIWQL